MDGQEYLDQISSENRPVVQKENKLLSSKLFLFGVGATVLLVLIIIIGSVLGSSKSNDADLSTALLFHLDNTSSIIEDYQPDVKSSDLRSISASLSSIIDNTSRELTAYLTEKYKYPRKTSTEKNLATAAELERDDLNNALFEAKINGLLDRTYAHKMTYEISIFLAEETKISNKTKDASLKSILDTSQTSLESLYDKFSSFSEAD